MKFAGRWTLSCEIFGDNQAKISRNQANNIKSIMLLYELKISICLFILNVSIRYPIPENTSRTIEKQNLYRTWHSISVSVLHSGFAETSMILTISFNKKWLVKVISVGQLPYATRLMATGIIYLHSVTPFSV